MVSFPLRNNIGLIKLRRRWMGHVARMKEMRNECKILVGKPEAKKYLGDQAADG
jgi:hypothetical protein